MLDLLLSLGAPPLASAGGAAVSRNFTVADSSNDEYFDLSELIVLTEFAIRIRFAHIDQSDAYYLLSNYGDESRLFYSPTSNLLYFGGSTGTVTRFTPVTVVEDEMNEVIITRDSSNGMYAEVNGVEAAITQGSTNSNSFKISAFGNLYNGGAGSVLRFDGRWESVEIWSDAAMTTKIHNFAMDEAGSETDMVDSIGGLTASKVGISAGATEVFTLNESTDPVQWENGDSSVIIPVAYDYGAGEGSGYYLMSSTEMTESTELYE